jgi:O-antigen ligase
VLFGPLAEVRIELILAVLIALVSLPAIARSSILKTPQSIALIGLSLASGLSVLFGMHWPGGAVKALLNFFPDGAFGYFLVCLHCNTKKRLKVVIVLLLFVCMFVIANGYFDLLHGISPGGPPQSAISGSSNIALWNLNHPYLLAMKSDAGEWFYRLRGQGFVNDPNDFGQVLACVIPLMFIFWRPGKKFLNAVIVLLPVCILIFGAYLTHSRGALVALTAIGIVAARRRIGTLPALIIAGALFAGAMALQFTGGRAISTTAGEDRTSLWGQGLEIMKTHPIFGVGYGNFMDYASNTAHNSIVVCAAELGAFGLFFWCLFLLPTVRDALVAASPEKVTDGQTEVPEQGLFPQPDKKPDEIDKEEINRLGRLMVMSLTGFLVAAMFLSRAYVLTFFLLGGMAEVVYQMALKRGMIVPRMRLLRLLPYAAGLAVALVLAIYILLRILNRMH